MSKRTDIVNAVKGELEKIPGVSVSTFLRKVEDVSDRGELPWLGVFFGAERKESAATAGPSAKRGELDVVVRMYARDEGDPLAALLALADAVEREVDDDPSLALPFPCFARVAEVSFLSTAEEIAEAGGARFAVGETLIRITYRHERANP